MKFNGQKGFLSLIAAACFILPFCTVSFCEQVYVGIGADNYFGADADEAYSDDSAPAGEAGSAGDGYGVEITDVYSRYAMLTDAETGEVIASRNADEILYPASITKLMTALVVAETLDGSTEITMPSSCIDYMYERDASISGFQPGEVLPVKDLMAGMLLPSGGDCCLCLAEYIAGSESAFADMMNAKAQELGMVNTHFVTCSGLHDENHYTTLQDLTLLMEAVMDNPLVYEVATSPTYTSVKTEEHPEGMTMTSTVFAFLAGRDPDNGHILGGKTGFTSEAGQCLASFAEVNGHKYILVTTGGFPDETDPHVNATDAVDIYNRYVP